MSLGETFDGFASGCSVGLPSSRELSVIIRATLITMAFVTASIAGAQAANQTPRSVSRADFAKNIDTRFAATDGNHDGVITKDELAAAEARALQRAGAVQQSRLEAEFKKLDTNHDNRLSLDEFKAAAPARKAGTGDRLLARFDTNKDGKVTIAEYRAPQLANFDKADTDRNGTLTAQEAQAARRR